MKYFFAIVSLSIILCSCAKEEEVDTSDNTNYSYFPLQEGRWIIYAVDSIAHLTDDDFTNQPDTSILTVHFQIKEVIDSAFTDAQGNEAFRVTRYRRLNDTLPWDFQVVWVAKRTYNSAQRVEDNIRYVRLQFPMNMNSVWNGNAFNYLPEEEYSYSDIHVPATIGPFTFDSTAVVLQLEDNNLLHRIFKQEKYANHVGLVYLQKDSLNINGMGR